MNIAVEKRTVGLDVVDELIASIKSHRHEITALLQTVESHQTIEDEFFKTLDCLENIDTEAPYINAAYVDNIASMPPVNLPMYSLVLFGVVPALMCRSLVLRPPLRMAGVYADLYDILDFARVVPNITLVANMERQEFTEAYTNHADVVLFTGTHRNATKIAKGIRKDALLIYNGAGINPIVVFDNADIDAAVRHVVFSKTFNSGQDCAGPDAILVDDTAAEAFMSRLTEEVRSLAVGNDYNDPDVVIGPLVERTQLAHLTKLLSRDADYIRYGGQIDFLHNVVTPTIIVKPVEQGANYDELFAPLFYVQTFNAASFRTYFDTDHYTNFAMYVSYFGSNETLESIVRDTTVLRETNIIEEERGNSAYGGYGYYASYVQHHNEKTSRPILISKEIADYQS